MHLLAIMIFFPPFSAAAAAPRVNRISVTLRGGESMTFANTLSKSWWHLYINLTGIFNPCWKMATFGESLRQGLATPGQRGKMLVVGRPFGPLGIMLIGFVSLFLPPPLDPEQSRVFLPSRSQSRRRMHLQCAVIHTHTRR